jgi:hypothetical protein
VRADEQLAPNKPIFSALALCMSTRARIDPLGAATAVSCIGGLAASFLFYSMTIAVVFK